jgi:hypothetical protein
MKVQFDLEKLEATGGKFDRTLFEFFLEKLVPDHNVPAPFKRYFAGLVIQKTQPEDSALLLASVTQDGMKEVARTLSAVRAVADHPSLLADVTSAQLKALTAAGARDAAATADILNQWVIRTFEEHVPGCTRNPDMLVERKAEQQLLN